MPFTAEETLLVRAEAEIIKKQYDAAVADLNAWTAAYLNTTKNTFTKDEIIAFYKALDYNSATAPTMKKKLHPSFTLDGGEDQEMLLHHLLQCRRVATAHEGHDERATLLTCVVGVLRLVDDVAVVVRG